MPTMQEWLDAYGQSHKNPINKLVHWICVPVIFVTLIGLCSLIPIPMRMLEGSDWMPYIHVGSVVIVLGLTFYIRLSRTMAVGMLLVSAISLYTVKWVNHEFIDQAWKVYLSAFALAWIGQFIGHKIEGKKPSFLDDLKFLLIGPAWLLGMLLRKLKIPY